MSYREKMAWLTFVCMALAYTLYFGLIATRPPGTMIDILILFGSISGTQALVVIAGSIWITMRAEQRGADERDKAIARRGATIGYYVLMTGTILVGVVMPFSETPWKIVNSALLALVIAEAVRLIVVLTSYRRGWHG